MNQVMQWFAMGGYAMYVWPAYGITVSVLLLNLVNTRWQKARIHKKLQHWL